MTEITDHLILILIDAIWYIKSALKKKQNL